MTFNDHHKHSRSHSVREIMLLNLSEGDSLSVNSSSFVLFCFSVYMCSSVLVL